MTVRCQPDKVENVQQFIDSNLQSAVLMERHYNQLRYQLSLKLDKVFLTMENAKENGIVLDFSLTQTTLEEVCCLFNTITNSLFLCFN